MHESHDPTHVSRYPWGNRLPTLESDRLILRWIEESDAPDLLRIFGDAETMRYWTIQAFTDLAMAVGLVHEIHQLFRDRILYQWGVVRREDGALIGTCTLHKTIWRHRRAEVGFILGRAFWGKGYMTETLGVLLSFAFDTLELHRLEADVDPRNARSLRVLERLGFRREGLLRQRYQVNGEIQDAVFLGLLADEWRRRSEGTQRAGADAKRRGVRTA